MYKTLEFNITEEVELGIDSTIESEFEKLLQSNSIDPQNLLYRAISGNNSQKKIQKLVKFGSDHPNYDSLYALIHEQVFITPTSPTLFDFADSGEPAVIAVYNKSMFRLDKDIEYLYHFMQPNNKLDSLVAIIKVNYI